MKMRFLHEVPLMNPQQVEDRFGALMDTGGFPASGQHWHSCSDWLAQVCKYSTDYFLLNNAPDIALVLIVQHSTTVASKEFHNNRHIDDLSLFAFGAEGSEQTSANSHEEHTSVPHRHVGLEKQAWTGVWELLITAWTSDGPPESALSQPQ